MADVDECSLNTDNCDDANGMCKFLAMTERIEQRHFIKFCQKLGDTQGETIRKIEQVLEVRP